MSRCTWHSLRRATASPLPASRRQCWTSGEPSLSSRRQKGIQGINHVAQVWAASERAEHDLGSGPLLELRHGNSVTSASFSPDGAWIISSSYDGPAPSFWEASGRASSRSRASPRVASSRARPPRPRVKHVPGVPRVQRVPATSCASFPASCASRPARPPPPPRVPRRPPRPPARPRMRPLCRPARPARPAHVPHVPHILPRVPRVSNVVQHVLPRVGRVPRSRFMHCC